MIVECSRMTVECSTTTVECSRMTVECSRMTVECVVSVHRCNPLGPPGTGGSRSWQGSGTADHGERADTAA